MKEEKSTTFGRVSRTPRARSLAEIEGDEVAEAEARDNPDYDLREGPILVGSRQGNRRRC